MICDLQKASLLKRAAAFMLDFILLTIVITGAAFALSAILDYDSYSEKLQNIYDEYEAEFGIDLDISSEEFSALPAEEQKKYEDVNRLMNENEEAIEAYNMTVNLALVKLNLVVLELALQCLAGKSSLPRAYVLERLPYLGPRA